MLLSKKTKPKADKINRKLEATIDICCKNKLFLEDENTKIIIVIIISIKFVKMKRDIKMLKINNMTANLPLKNT